MTAATLTITDNDQASDAITLLIDPDTVSEDDATTTITVTAALNRDARTEDTEVTVAVGKDSDSAVAGTDYTTVSDLRVTIPAGSRMATETFSFAPINDIVAEGSETVSVTGTADSLDVTAATLTITDNDQASDAITLLIDPDTVSEDDATATITVTAALNRDARTEDTEVTVAVGKDSDSAVAGTDYTTVSDLRVIIPAGSRMATETFSFAPINDIVAEGSETVSVTGTADSLDVTAATLTITDNDQASDAITLLIDPDTVSEDDATTTITVTAALNRDARTEDTEVTVAVGKDSDSAVAGTDYTIVSDLRVTIPAGSRMATETFSFAPINDTVAEGSETVSVTGTADSLDVTAATLTRCDHPVDYRLLTMIRHQMRSPC